MMKNIYTPTTARKNLFMLIKQANAERKPIRIEPTKEGEKGVVIIGEDDWDAIQETLFLIENGVDKQIREREKDDEEDFKQVWQSL